MTSNMAGVSSIRLGLTRLVGQIQVKSSSDRRGYCNPYAKPKTTHLIKESGGPKVCRTIVGQVCNLPLKLGRLQTCPTGGHEPLCSWPCGGGTGGPAGG